MTRHIGQFLSTCVTSASFSAKVDKQRKREPTNLPSLWSGQYIPVFPVYTAFDVLPSLFAHIPTQCRYWVSLRLPNNPFTEERIGARRRRVFPSPSCKGQSEFRASLFFLLHTTSTYYYYRERKVSILILIIDGGPLSTEGKKEEGGILFLTLLFLLQPNTHSHRYSTLSDDLPQSRLV